jgi:hypothetical protein
MVAIRITGPAERVAEVDAAMQAFLDSMLIGSPSPPHPAALLTIAPCSAGPPAGDAHLLPDANGAELVALGFLATLDGGGIEAEDKDHGGVTMMASRVPDHLCESSRLTLGSSIIPILRAEEGPALSIDGRTMLVAVLNDAGNYLEIVHSAKLGRYLLLHHDIARTAVLGSFDAVPSDAQIGDIIANPDNPAARARVPVTFQPDKGPNIHVPAAAPAATSETRT